MVLHKNFEVLLVFLYSKLGKYVWFEASLMLLLPHCSDATSTDVPNQAFSPHSVIGAEMAMM